jgi:hypothetical protein
MREAYRINKDILSSAGASYQIALNYIDKDQQPYEVIEKAMRKAFKKIGNTDINS